MKKYTCQICKKDFIKSSIFPLKYERESVLNEAKQINPDLDPDGFICNEDLKILRTKFVESILKSYKKELSDLDKMVINSFKEHEIITGNVNKKFDQSLTASQRLADVVAKFGGSWKFIIIFLSFVLFWVIYIYFLHDAYGPYPYILLNLMLSSLAALQAPIIMMGQNRQAQKDRLKSDDDYLINLKAELEIRHLNAKLDQFIKNQWDSLLEIQQIQLDLTNELLKNKEKK